MRWLARISLALALVCLCAQGGHAGEHRRISAAEGNAYNYPLTGLPQPAAAYGLRQLSATYTGCSVIVRRQSDNAQKTICFVQHNFDSATAAAFAGVDATVTASMGASFTGTGTLTSLVVTGVTGYISAGDVISGSGIPGGTTISSQMSGTTGGAGTYITSGNTTAAAASLTTTSNVLAVSNVISGTINVNDQIYAPGLARGTAIKSGSGLIWTTANLSGVQQSVAMETFTVQSALFVPEWFDQSGNTPAIPMLQSTAALQPQLLLYATPTGEPTLYFNGSTQFMATGTSGMIATYVNFNSPLTLAAITERTGSPSTIGNIVNNYNGSGGQTGLAFNSTANQALVNVGNGGNTQTVAATDGSFHVLIGALGASTFTIRADETTSSPVTATSNVAGAPVSIGVLNASGVQYLTGAESEAVVTAGVAWTTAQQNLYQTNAKAWAGTP